MSILIEESKDRMESKIQDLDVALIGDEEELPKQWRGDEELKVLCIYTFVAHC